MGICEDNDTKKNVDLETSEEVKEQETSFSKPGDNFNPKDWELPQKNGLYDPSLEKDACGVGFVVSIDGISSHKVRFFYMLSPVDKSIKG